MRPSRLARLLVASAGALLAAGIATVSVLPGALGLSVLLYLHHTRSAARQAFRQVHPRVERRVLEPVVHEGRTFHVELDATATPVGRGVAVTLEDVPPQDARPFEPHRASAGERARYRLRAERRGALRFERLRMHLQDGRNLWVETRELHLETHVNVLPRPGSTRAAGRDLRREGASLTAAAALGRILNDLEIEGLRPYMPGDRLRDVDWKRYAQLRRPLTRERTREKPVDLAILLDAGRTMRAKVGHGPSKLDEAARLALGLAEAAVLAGARVRYLAFDETTVLDAVPAANGEATRARLRRHLARLPSRIPVHRRLDVSDASGRALPGDAPFAMLLSRLRGETSTGERDRGVEEAVRRIRREAGDRTLLIVTLTDLEAVPEPTLDALTWAVGAGHRAILAVFPGTRYLETPTRILPHDVEAAYRENVVRRRAARRLSRAGARVLELGPGDSPVGMLDTERRRGA